MRAWWCIGGLLIGCGEQSGFGGQDLGEGDNTAENSPLAEDNGDSTAGAASPTVDTDTAYEECVKGAEDTLSELFLSPGTGLIDVQHDAAVAAPCDAEWRHDLAVGDFEVEVDYVITNTPSSGCECGWTFHYQLTDLAPGTWTVTAASVVGTVVVE